MAKRARQGGGIPASGALDPAAPEAALLDSVQRQTLRYFLDYGHPVSGLARERYGPGPGGGKSSPDTVSSGGSGFGMMAMLAGIERGWIDRAEALARLSTMVGFLAKADRYHGVFSHWIDGRSGRTIPFWLKDDGADLVETSFLMAGLLAVRQYFAGPEEKERALRELVDVLWREVEWDWHTRGEAALYWHWSPVYDWAMNAPIRGWNECLITYVLAAGSPTHAIAPEVYHRCYASGPTFRNGRRYGGLALPLGPEGGGPLFFAHYSFLGIDPRGLRDRYADYWQQNRAQSLINRAYCIANPKGFAGYGVDCWGLTASDSVAGYVAHSPTDDWGVITPSAALSSYPYTPEASLRALRHFASLGELLWTEYGFCDAFSETAGWYAPSHIAIDQGPIVVMIENHRSGLIWRLLMSCPEVRRGLAALGFTQGSSGASGA
jgi:hypothetical protein